MVFVSVFLNFIIVGSLSDLLQETPTVKEEPDPGELWELKLITI